MEGEEDLLCREDPDCFKVVGNTGWFTDIQSFSDIHLTERTSIMYGECFHCRNMTIPIALNVENAQHEVTYIHLTKDHLCYDCRQIQSLRDVVLLNSPIGDEEDYDWTVYNNLINLAEYN
jgi:hypothetical protein